jgi:hypothetical protein
MSGGVDIVVCILAIFVARKVRSPPIVAINSATRNTSP